MRVLVETDFRSSLQTEPSQLLLDIILTRRVIVANNHHLKTHYYQKQNLALMRETSSINLNIQYFLYIIVHRCLRNLY